MRGSEVRVLSPAYKSSSYSRHFWLFSSVPVYADPHHAIQDLGWINEQSSETGESTRLQVYDWIKNENGKAYVRDKHGNTAYVCARPEVLHKNIRLCYQCG